MYKDGTIYGIFQERFIVWNGLVQDIGGSSDREKR